MSKWVEASAKLCKVSFRLNVDSGKMIVEWDAKQDMLFVDGQRDCPLCTDLRKAQKHAIRSTNQGRLEQRRTFKGSLIDME